MELKVRTEIYDGTRIYLRRTGYKPLSLVVMGQVGRFVIGHDEYYRCSAILDLSTEATRKIRFMGRSCNVYTYDRAEGSDIYRTPSEAQDAAEALSAAEAQDATEIPAVPCSVCKGEGEVVYDLGAGPERMVCPQCEGAGELPDEVDDDGVDGDDIDRRLMDSAA